jgi:thiol-disulfide isomerase/thioredoxin
MWVMWLACAGTGVSEPDVPPTPPVVDAAPDASEPQNATWVEVQPGEPLTEQLAAHAAAAAELEQIPVAYIGASWCPPCVAFKKNRDTQEIASALRGIYLIEIDADVFMGELPDAGFSIAVIPYWFRLNPQGRPADEGLTGDRWRDLTPATVGRELAEYFARV